MRWICEATLAAIVLALNSEWCPGESLEQEHAHCSHWYDCEPCCRCGWDGGGDYCDCPRHTAERELGLVR